MDRIMKTMTIGMAVFLVVSLALPAAAHTEAEQQQWEQEWQERFDEVVDTLPLNPEAIKDLVVERADFQVRHAPPPRTVSRSTSTTSTNSTSTNRGMGSNVEQWRGLVATYFSDVDRALCIMSHESGGNPTAKNPRSSARGLFQILASLWAPHYGVSYSDLYDPELNVRLAADIHAQYGWSAWSPYQRGLCR